MWLGFNLIEWTKRKMNQIKKLIKSSYCLPCFCSVSCAQGMTFCSTRKGCGSHIIKCVHSGKLKAMCNVQVWRVDGLAQTLLLTRVAKSTSTCQHNAPFGQFDSSPKLKATLKTNWQIIRWHSTQLRHIVSSQSSTLQISAAFCS